jgi:hypothetical protein
MAIEDLTPFGTLPSAYQGLLSTQDAAALQKRAQVQGLLGAGLALAKGMSAYGPPRSALQNIIGSVAGGFESAGGAYEGGLRQAMTAQDIRQKQIQIQQSDALRRDVENVMRTPEVANNPSLVALLRADPKEGLKWINENMAVTQAYAKTMPQQQQAVAGSPEAQANTVTAPMDERARLFAENKILTGIGTKPAREKIESNLKQIKSIDEQEEIVRKQQDFTNEARRVAGYLFPNHDFSQPLNAQQSKQLNDELQKLEVAKRRAGATNVNVGDKSFNTEFGKGVAASVETTYNSALGAKGTISTIQGIRPLIQAGVYSGPLSSAPRVVDQFASSLGIASGTTEEKLARTAEAMQGLAQIELSAASALKGQGAITENERGLIARAAGGNFKDFTQKEVLALLNAMEKTSQSKIRTHEKNLGLLRKRKDTAELADFYSLGDEQQKQAPASPAAAPAGGVRKYNPATGRIE